MVVAKSFIIVCLRILDGVFDRSMVGCKDVWCVATLVVLMFSVCRPCAQVAGMATEKEGPPPPLQLPPHLKRSHEAYVTERFHGTILEHLPVHAIRYLASSATFAHTTTAHFLYATTAMSPSLPCA
jgi:hypothetical protein